MSLQISSVVLEAAKDMKYLLDRGYPKKYALNFVSNHYLLSKDVRNLLSRTVHSRNTSLKRCKKLISPYDITSKAVVIDGFNVLITIEAMLRGHSLFIGTDSIVRDLEQSHGKYKKSQFTEMALFLIFLILNELHPKESITFFDSQVSYSKKILSHATCISTKFNVRSKLYLEKTVDSIIKKAYSTEEYVILTSDSIIIDSVTFVFDLPRYLSKILNYPVIQVIKSECENGEL